MADIVGDMGQTQVPCPFENRQELLGRYEPPLAPVATRPFREKAEKPHGGEHSRGPSGTADTVRDAGRLEPPRCQSWQILPVFTIIMEIKRQQDEQEASAIVEEAVEEPTVAILRRDGLRETAQRFLQAWITLQRGKAFCGCLTCA